MDKHVILDRDGVINVDRENYVLDYRQFEWIPGSKEALYQLFKLDYHLHIVTNQSCISKGLLIEGKLETIYNKMEQDLFSHSVYFSSINFCPHTELENCNCRKPRMDMINEIVRNFNISKSHMLLVGDSICDFETSIKSNIPFYLVRTGNGLKTEKYLESIKIKVPVFDNLFHISKFLEQF